MSESEKLLVSIVTVCLNSERTIRDTLESVRQQSYPDIEHIIVDGVSSDSTLKIVEEFGDSVSIVISEKDNGIYDAMNKGLSLSTGNIIYFLNSDDVLHDADVIRDVVARFEQKPQPDLVYGDVVYVSSDMQELRRFNRVSRRNLIYRDLCHQGVLARRTLFERFGNLNLDYRIAADFDWLLKVFRSDSPVAYLDRVISVFNAEGEHGRDLESARKERMVVKLQYQSRLRYALGNTLFRGIRKLRSIFGG